MLTLFEKDPETSYVVMVGEIGGDEEEKAADFIESEMTKPVVAYIAGFTAPPGRRWGTRGRSSRALPELPKGRSRPSRLAGSEVGRTPTETAHLAAELALTVAGLVLAVTSDDSVRMTAERRE